MIRRRLAAPTLAALVLGCGGLEIPDLDHGAVTGQISSAVAGKAYAYVLGSPDITVAAAADGSFRLDNVPAGTAQIVMFDGNVGAESVEVEVNGASVSHVDLGRTLKPASAILAALSPVAGVSTAQLSFTVAGTPLQNVPGFAGAKLWPLPAGRFTLLTSLPGFTEASVEVELDEGLDLPELISLDIDPGSAQPGCNGSGGCENGLKCASDGACVECTTNADCPGSGVCEGSHCGYPGTGTWCQACNRASDCAQGSGVDCLNVNAAGGAVSGYCSYGCASSADCPAGYTCTSRVGGSSACEPLVSCLAIKATFGSSCRSDDPCRSALEGGRCLGATSTQPGYCTADCAGGCPQGWTCSSMSGEAVCLMP